MGHNAAEAELMIVRGKNASDHTELFEFTIEPFVSGGFLLDIFSQGNSAPSSTTRLNVPMSGRSARHR